MERCICGHRRRQHRAVRRPGTRGVDEVCTVPGCECVDLDPLDPEDETTTLIYAWDAALCSSCEWRTSADVSACLQCGAALVPVRHEVHERESP